MQPQTSAPTALVRRIEMLSAAVIITDLSVIVLRDMKSTPTITQVGQQVYICNI